MLIKCFSCNTWKCKLHKSNGFYLIVHCWVPRARNSARHLKVNKWILKTTVGTIIRPILHVRKLKVTEVEYLTQKKYSKKVADPRCGSQHSGSRTHTLNLHCTAFHKECILWPIRRFRAEGQMVLGVMAQLIFHIWTLYDHDWKQKRMLKPVKCNFRKIKAKVFCVFFLNEQLLKCSSILLLLLHLIRVWKFIFFYFLCTIV